MAVNKKRILQGVLLTVGIIFNIWGILTLIQTAGHDAGISVGLTYMDGIPHIIHKYVIVVIMRMIGILSLSNWAAQLEGKKKNVLSIVFCAYSTILTIPLFLTFVLCFFVASGVFSWDMVDMICFDLIDIFGTPGAYYTIFALGTLMGAVFLAVPIISTYCTVKNIDLLGIILTKLKIKKPAGGGEQPKDDPSAQSKASAEDETSSAKQPEDKKDGDK